MSKAIERKILKIYNEVYKKIFNSAAISTLATGSTSIVASNVATLQSSKQYEEFCKQFATELAKRGLANQRGVWRKFFDAAKASRHIALKMSYKDYEFKQMRKAIEHNFTMIQSIPTRMLDILQKKYLSTLIEEVAKGALPRGSFAKQLSIHAGKQAKVIARTETAKLQTAITENRATDLGSVAYIWKSSKDIRTRPSHRMMNGVVVFWRQGTQKPLLDKMYGNAGEFPNCRCTPLPIFDESDLKENSYKVYNYTTHSIIDMKKKDLINVITQGALA